VEESLDLSKFGAKLLLYRCGACLLRLLVLGPLVNDVLCNKIPAAPLHSRGVAPDSNLLQEGPEIVDTEIDEVKIQKALVFPHNFDVRCSTIDNVLAIAAIERLRKIIIYNCSTIDNVLAIEAIERLQKINWRPWLSGSLIRNGRCRCAEPVPESPGAVPLVDIFQTMGGRMNCRGEGR
jgi:hypothetical protein